MNLALFAANTAVSTSVLAGDSLATLSGDGVAHERSDEFSMLLGPVHLGYVCGGHQGAGSGVREEACLSIRGALSDVAGAVGVGKRELHVANVVVGDDLTGVGR